MSGSFPRFLGSCRELADRHQRLCCREELLCNAVFVATGLWGALFARPTVAASDLIGLFLLVPVFVRDCRTRATVEALVRSVPGAAIVDNIGEQFVWHWLTFIMLVLNAAAVVIALSAWTGCS